jgi:ribonuclease P protein component
VKRSFRITQGSDFKRVRQTGKSFAHPLAVLIKSISETEETRFGFICSKGYGNAVERNRTKRQLRAIIQTMLPSVTSGSDIIIIARDEAKKASFSQIQTAIINLCKRAKVISANEQDPGNPTRTDG